MLALLILPHPAPTTMTVTCKIQQIGEISHLNFKCLANVAGLGEGGATLQCIAVSN